MPKGNNLVCLKTMRNIFRKMVMVLSNECYQFCCHSALFVAIIAKVEPVLRILRVMAEANVSNAPKKRRSTGERGIQFSLKC